MYRESADIQIDFAHAHLRQGNFLASRNLEFTEIFSQETGESFADRMDGCLKLIGNTTRPNRGVWSRVSIGESATKACIFRVEALINQVGSLIEKEYLIEEP